MKRINAYMLDERDRAFSPYRTPDSAEVEFVVEEVLKRVRLYELHTGRRSRGRRKSAHENLIAALTALTCDLIHRALTSEHGAGRVHLSRMTGGKQKRNRYRAAFEGRPLIEAIDLLSAPELNLATLCERGQYTSGRESAYKAGPNLLSLIDELEHPLEVDCVTLSEDEEIVILKKGKDDLRTAALNRAGWIDYEDTEMSLRCREEVRRINAFIAEADLDYSGGRMIDLTNRRQRRYFNNSEFADGGRLFGGFWLSELRAKQRKHLSIDGTDVVEIDYRAMMPSLAYANQGLTIPADADPYLIPGIGRNKSEQLRWRTGVKRLFASMLFATKPITRWPKNVREENFQDCPHSLPEIVEAIKTQHEPLTPLWERGLGHQFQFEESELIVTVLLTCIDEGITALQTHDGVVVRFDHAPRVAQIMLEAFQRHTGQETVVKSTATRLPITNQRKAS